MKRIEFFGIIGCVAAEWPLTARALSTGMPANRWLTTFLFVPWALLASIPQSSAQTTMGPSETLTERVVLFNENPTDPKGQRYDGSVVWRSTPIKPPAGQLDDAAIYADVEIPETDQKITFVLRRNFDPALRASHVVELTFAVPPDFADSGIDKVPGLLTKSSEFARGTPLKGLSAKIADKVFWFGLSNVPEDRAYNLMLLGNAWISIPVIYSNQRRAIIAIEKGATGSAIFQATFAAWGENPR
jgi:hypothetical protein